MRTPIRPKFRPRTLATVIATSALAFGVAACGDDEGGGGSAAVEGGGTQEIVALLSYQDSIIWTGYEVARSRFYETLGLDVSTESSNGTAYTIQQLTAGNVPFAVSGAADLIVANAQGRDLVSVANINTDLFTVRATPESGITEISQLRGKALGVTDLGGGEIPLVNAVLRDADLEPGKDVELKVLGDGGPATARALETGEVAAFAGAPNDMSGISSAGGIELNSILPESYSGLPSNEIIVTRETLQDKEQLELALRIAGGWFQGTLYAKDNPDEALAAICELVPAECRDKASAEAFFDVALAGEVSQAAVAGEHDLKKYELVNEAIVGSDIPNATSDVDLESIFTNDYIDEIEGFMKEAGGQ